MKAAIRAMVMLAALVVALGYLAPPEAAGQAGRAAATTDPERQPATQPTTQPTTQAGGKVIEGLAEEWLTKMVKGGWTIVALIVLSVIGVAFTLERLFMLRRGVLVPRGLSARTGALWRQGRYDEIVALCRQRPSTLGRVLTFIVTHRDAPVADVSTTAGDIASRELKRHLLRAYPLAVVATLAPLLGLLGTVIGMIEAFDTVVLVGLGDAAALAGGISKALITTMVGLCIAVPTLFVYHFFRSRTNLFGVMLEEEVTELIADWRMKETRTHAG